MKVNFETLAALFTFIINAAGVATLMWLLERTELKDMRDNLSAAIKIRASDPPYVRRLFGKLTRELLGWLLVLHIVNILVYAAAGAILRIGPENIFIFSKNDPLAAPLSASEKAIFWIWLGVTGLVYFIRGISPTFRLVTLWARTFRWLRQNEA